MTQGILSIQSHVAYGHVGNSAAVFPLQRLGFEVWPVDTVQFSNHTGYGAWRGPIIKIDDIREILTGVEERGAFERTIAVLSGYLGDPSLGEAVLETVEAVRRARKGALYVCDPVMGDVGRGFFVRAGLPEFFKAHAVPAADIITPNQFELSFLADRQVESLDDALAASAAVRATGPALVVVTSLHLPGCEGELAVLADNAEGSWLVRTPDLPASLSGTGDVFTALLIGHSLREKDTARALDRAVNAMFALVEATHRAGSRELVLVEAQDAFARPPQRFEIERLR